VVVFHQTPLTANQQSLLSAAIPGPSGLTGDRREAVSPSVNALDAAASSKVSARVVTADVARLEQPYQQLWAQLSAESPLPLPYVVVRAKVGTARTVNAWHGPFDSISDWDVFQSPARREIAKRLLAGHSVVWLVIAAKDEQRNAKVRKMLEENLDALADKIQLPDGIGLPGSELYSEIPLLVKFSVLEIARDDPREAFLIQLFSSFRSEAFASGEALVIPVFGRGRALEVIPGSDLHPRLLEELTAFLSGACSCQVKEQNPGFDLLFSVDWNTELFGEGFEPPPPRPLGGGGQPELLTIPPGR
jgi:hypothetical protein